MKQTTFIWLMVAVMLIGVAGIFCPDQLVRATGEAFFIAGFLAVTVDAFVKERLAKQVSADVVTAALGYHVPDEIMEEIREISSFKTIRRDVDLTYRISEYEASREYVWVHSDLEYDVENLTDTPQAYRHLIWVQKPFRLKDPLQQVLFAKAVGLGGGADYELDEAHLSQADVKTEHAVEWCREVTIPPRAKVKFWSGSRQILPAEHVDTFWLVQPTVGVKVRVYADGRDTVVNFAHRRSEEAQRAGNTWNLRAGFPPYATVTIEWRTKSVPSVAPSGPPTRSEVEQTKE